MADLLLKEKLQIIPFSAYSSEVEVERQACFVELNTENPGYTIFAIEGVNDRGKTILAKQFASEHGYDMVKEPPFYKVPGQEDKADNESLSWYDILVKGKLDKENYLLTLFEANRPLIREILVNSGVKSLDDETLCKLEDVENNPALIKFWGFVFSRLCYKNDLIEKSKKEPPEKEKVLISDRNIMTALVFNLCEHKVEAYDEEALKQALMVYAYLGENNYVPVSKHTIAITSEEDATYVGERREGDDDVNDGNREFQEKIYRKVLDLRRNGEYSELMSKFLGKVWHIEMSHIPPYQGNWEDSIDSEILLAVLSKIRETGTVPDLIELSYKSSIIRKLGNVYCLTRPDRTLHKTGDFEIVLGDGGCEVFIKPRLSFLRTSREKLVSHLYWYISSLRPWTGESAIKTRDWFESMLRMLTNFNVSVLDPITVGTGATQLDRKTLYRNFFQRSLAGFAQGYGFEPQLALSMISSLSRANQIQTDLHPSIQCNDMTAFSVSRDFSSLAEEKIGGMSLVSGFPGLYSPDTGARDAHLQFADLLIKGRKSVEKIHMVRTMVQNPSPDLLLLDSDKGVSDFPNGTKILSVALEVQVGPSGNKEIGRKRFFDGSLLENLDELISRGIVRQESLLIYRLEIVGGRPIVKLYMLDLTHQILSEHLIKSGFYTNFIQNGLDSFLNWI